MNRERTALLKLLGPDIIIGHLGAMITDERRDRFKQAIDAKITNVTVVAESLFDPLNGNALLRTCEAFGLMDVHFVVPHDDYRLSKKVTIGAERWLNVHVHDTTTDAFQFLDNKGFTQWATVPPFAGWDEDRQFPPPQTTLRELPVTEKIALWMGNERLGLSAEAKLRITNHFTIPMYGLSQSLNLSVSTAICVENVVAKWRNAGMTTTLADQEKRALLARWLLEDCRRPEATLRTSLAREGVRI